MEESRNYEKVEIISQEQETLPNANLVLIFGILSIPLSCCCLLISLPFGIVAWVLGHKGIKRYRENPQAYTSSSYNNMNAGKITAIIGVILTILMLLVGISNIIRMGGIDAYMEQIKQIAEQYR